MEKEKNLDEELKEIKKKLTEDNEKKKRLGETLTELIEDDEKKLIQIGLIREDLKKLKEEVKGYLLEPT